MTTYTYPATGGGSQSFKDPVATFTSLPATGNSDGDVRVTLDTQVVYIWSGTMWVSDQASAVVGPASATDTAVVRFQGTTGKTVQNSTVLINNLGDTSGIRNLTATGTTTIATSLTGPVHSTAGVLSASPISLTADVSGILPIANGGTNSSTALNNNRVMQSSAGQVVEAAAITASRALASDANGIPVAATTTATELGYVNGVTSAIQTQLNTKFVLPSLTSGSVLFSDGTTIAQDNAALNWNDGTQTLTLTTPNNSTGALVINVDAGGAHGYGNAIVMPGNPGGGMLISRGRTDSALELLGGDGENTGGTIYLNGNTYTGGGAGGIQTSFGMAGASFDIFEHTVSTQRFSVHDDGTIFTPVVGASKAVVSDASSNLIGSTTTAAEIGFVSGVTSAIQTQLNGKQPSGSYITALTGDVAASGPGSVAATIQALAVTNAKIANATIDLTAKVTNALPIANGGTNSSTVLNNNRLMQSSGGAIVEAAAITASRALASDANGIPVASATTATQLGYLSGITGALSSPQAPNVNMWLYVSQYGSDATGDGTYNKPFATTAAARASIGGNNSSTNRYGIHIRGTISEPSIYLLPYVWYYGDTWGNSRLNASTDNAIKLDPTAFTSGNSRSGMTNIYLTGSTGINLDFVAVAASGSHVVEIASIGVNGAVVINSNNTNQYFQWMGDSLCFSNFTVHGTQGLIQGVFIAGNLITDNGTAGIVSSGINFIGCFIGGNFTHTGDGTHANIIQFNSSFISGTTTATGASSTIYADAVSIGLKSTVSIGSGASLVRLNDVYPLSYTPTTSGNWTVVPANAQDALDTLATEVTGKEPTQTKGSISTSTTGVTIGSGANSTVGPAVTVNVQNATTAQNGLLTSTDWNTFNGKQSSGSYITALTGDVAASGPGSAAATIQALAVTNAKIANATIDLTAKVTGILPIANGGTNSSTALSNNRFIVSTGSAIVEASAVTASRAVVSDTNGLPTASVTTTTELSYVSGVTSAIQTQLNAITASTIVAVSSNVTLTNRAIHLVDTTSARSLTLPSPTSGTSITVKDSTGSAGTNNITIVRFGTEKIETVAASYVLNSGLGSWTFTSNGTDWFII